MRVAMVVSLLAALVCTAGAGGNPDVSIYIDFDPPNEVHEYYPEPYSTFDAYICLGDIDMGVTSVAFRLSDPTETCPGVFAPPSFTVLWPG